MTTSESTPTPGPVTPDAGKDTLTSNKGTSAPDTATGDKDAVLTDTGPRLSLHYQAAGQARQVRNELANLEAYGAGDGERARALRRTLKEMGVDPDAAVDATGDAPAGRSAKTEKMVRTDAPGPSTASTSSPSSSTTAPVKPSASK